MLPFGWQDSQENVPFVEPGRPRTGCGRGARPRATGRCRRSRGEDRRRRRHPHVDHREGRVARVQHEGGFRAALRVGAEGDALGQRAEAHAPARDAVAVEDEDAGIDVPGAPGRPAGRRSPRR